MSVTMILVSSICCVCAVPFGVPAEFEKARKSDGKLFYCPSGHPQNYIDTTTRLAKADAALAGKTARVAELEKEIGALKMLVPPKPSLAQVVNPPAKSAIEQCIIDHPDWPVRQVAACLNVSTNKVSGVLGGIARRNAVLQAKKA